MGRRARDRPLLAHVYWSSYYTIGRGRLAFRLPIRRNATERNLRELRSLLRRSQRS